jgi:hypothetical protein
VASYVPPVPLSEAAFQDVIGKPTLVTFSGKKVPLEEIVAVFRNAAGLPPGLQPALVMGPKTPKTISVRWKRVPFWDAARQVEAHTGLVWTVTEDKDLSLRPGYNGLNGRVVTNTPFFKVIATDLMHHSFAQMGLDPRPKNSNFTPTSDSTRVSLMVYPDPKLVLDPSSIHVGQVKVTLDKTTLPPSTGYWESDSRASLIFRREGYINLGLRTGTRLKSVSGTLLADAMLFSQTWNVPDLTKAPAAKMQMGTGEYALESAVLQSRTLTVNASASIDAVLKPDVFGKMVYVSRPNLAFSQLEVRDGLRRKLRRERTTTTCSGEGPRQTAKSEIVFLIGHRAAQEVPGPFSLQWTVPTAMSPIAVPFELKNVMIP